MLFHFPVLPPLGRLVRLLFLGAPGMALFAPYRTGAPAKAGPGPGRLGSPSPGVVCRSVGARRSVDWTGRSARPSREALRRPLAARLVQGLHVLALGANRVKVTRLCPSP